MKRPLSIQRQLPSVARWAALALASVLSPLATALEIDNGLTPSQPGYWSVDVVSGGATENAQLTATRAGDGRIVTRDVVFLYAAYVEIGERAFQLQGRSPQLENGQVVSVGSFASGNDDELITWRVVSSIEPGSPVLVNTYTFTATGGTLNELRLFQYLDEDVEAISDDIFFTRGTAADGTLQLFTVDGPQVFGVSQSGAFSAAQGLFNARFNGWAAGVFNRVVPAILNRSQGVDPNGVISDLGFLQRADLGPVRGPADVVSAAAWRVDAGARSATIVTTLGGIPDASALSDVLVSPARGLVTTEGGGSAQFNVVLTGPPDAPVTIDLSSSNTDEGRVEPQSLRFSATDWDRPRRVVVSGVDDTDDDGNAEFSIVTSAVVSDDPDYDGLDPADVMVVNIDDDGELPDLRISPIVTVSSEGGQAAMIGVRLTQPPSAEVSIGLRSDDPSEGQPAESELVFTPDNWRMQRQVMIRGVDDQDVDGDVAYIFITDVAVSTDPGYSGRNPADVSLINIDNEGGERLFGDSFEEPQLSGGGTSSRALRPLKPRKPKPL